MKKKYNIYEGVELLEFLSDLYFYNERINTEELNEDSIASLKKGFNKINENIKKELIKNVLNKDVLNKDDIHNILKENLEKGIHEGSNVHEIANEHEDFYDKVLETLNVLLKEIEKKSG